LRSADDDDQNGRQFRAILRNASGSAASTAATLTVSASAIAPTIATSLSKNYRVIVNLTAVDVDPAAPALSLQVKPVFACSSVNYGGACSVGGLGVRRLDQGATLEYKFAVNFDWGPEAERGMCSKWTRCSWLTRCRARISMRLGSASD
jgi:hypothetical protein